MTTTADIQVAERPILFSGEMVRVILDGRKSQTRRVIKPQAGDVEGAWLRPDGLFIWTVCKGVGVSLPFACPYGEPGDRLWVRETFAPHPNHGIDFIYRADPASDYQWGAGKPSQSDFRWKPSIHMPRWASRITLELLKVRVERVQEITEEDAITEGVIPVPFALAADGNDLTRLAFIDIWQSLNKKRPGCSWDANPWVWVLEFRRVKE